MFSIIGVYTSVIFVAVFLILTIAGAPLIGIFAGVLIAIAAVALSWSKATDVVLDLNEAEAASETLHPRLFNTTAGLCAAMGVAPPSLYIVDDPAINAFATGIDVRNANLAVTSGALEDLSLVEFEGVLALQLHRIRAGDIVPETLAVTTVGLPLVLSEMTDRWPLVSRFFALPSNLIAKFLSKLYSKRDELDRDLAAVRYTRFPPALAMALEKMKGRTAVVAATPVTAHLWIASPLAPTARAVPVVHATLDERVAILQEL